MPRRDGPSRVGLWRSARLGASAGPQPPETEGDPSTGGAAARSARWSWQHPAAPWATAAALFVLATTSHYLFGLKADADESQLNATRSQLQSQLDEKKIFPPANAQFSADAYPLKRSGGDTMTISFNFDGTSGQASGTEVDAGSPPKPFHWHLKLESIQTFLADGVSVYRLQPDESTQYYIFQTFSPNGDQKLQVCLYDSAATLSCFE